MYAPGDTSLEDSAKSLEPLPIPRRISSGDEGALTEK